MKTSVCTGSRSVIGLIKRDDGLPVNNLNIHNREGDCIVKVLLRTHYPYSGTEEIMETKLVRIAEISATSKHPIFTSVYHLINEDMLKQCHKELDGNKAVGIDKVTKDEYGKNLDRNIKELVQRLKNKSFKPLPSLRVYIPKGNGKKRPLGIASYEDKIVQMAVKKYWELFMNRDS